ncbi:MAG: hypothetical protein ABIT20_11215 [Gemmatimonadaceae bacterium]
MRAIIAVAMVLSATTLHAQSDSLDDRLVALTYHKLSGETIDLRAAAEHSPAVQRASGFDRPDVITSEVARLEHDMASADAKHEFVMRVNDNISEYDHDRGEFSVMLFKPGVYIDIRALGQQYRLVFGNADGLRAIPMPDKEAARSFDAKLASTGRFVSNEIRFRVAGTGDPSGAVTGQHVIRAEIISARLLDRNGNVVFTPHVNAAAPVAVAKRLDAGANDVAGLHVGVRAKDLEATMQRMYGPVSRQKRSNNWFAGYQGALVVNDMKCMDMPGRTGGSPQPGTVCVTAWIDGSDVVRSIRVERVFSYMDAETFRSTLVKKYGPVSGAKEGGTYALGWGAPVDSSLVYDHSGPRTSVAAYYDASDDMFSRSMNALPRIRVILQLVDAQWATAQH